VTVKEVEASTKNRTLAPAEVRALARRGQLDGQTSGMSPGYVQGNVVILPEEAASEFLLYCQRNPKPCPLLAVSDVGDPRLPALGEGIDIRTDIPRYRVFRDGVLVDRPTDIGSLWRDDLVTFVLGCSFSFEEALIEAGVPLRHIGEGSNVPMYRTNIATAEAGRFKGELVVSMRPMTPANAIRAVQVTSRYGKVHGAPVHLGDPSMIGIAELANPDFGDAAGVGPEEIPVFWACGVTPQVAILGARVDLCMTHDPGSMLVTDLLNSHLADF
jgi:uncharacterized protein YcsI (UPF0317 family)